LQIRGNYLAPISSRLKETTQDYLVGQKDCNHGELQTLLSIHEAAREMKEWPFDVEVITQLVGSILLPILIVLLQLRLGLFG
jgi:hypothetical protein